MKKWVYFFGASKAEGDGTWRDLLGGKGAGLAEMTRISEKDLLSWANTADRMRIKGVGEEYASLLQAAGVDTVKELKYRNPGKLAKAIAEANRKRKLVGVLPSDHAVVRWIEYAKKLPLKITY